MLSYDQIARIAKKAAQEAAPPKSVLDILVEPTTDSIGEDALRVTVVIGPNAIEQFKDGGALNIVVAINKALRDAGEERLPIVWWATEAELEDVGDS